MNLEASSENLYNNADRFAMAFDAAWKDCNLVKHDLFCLIKPIEV